MNPVISRLKQNQQRSNESSKKRLLGKNMIRYETQNIVTKRSSSKLSVLQTNSIIGAFNSQNNEFKTQMPLATEIAVEDSFMNDSFDVDVQPESCNKTSQNVTQTTKDKSGITSNPMTHRRREMKDKTQQMSRNMIQFKAADNMVYSDLLSEGTIMSPNYNPPKNLEERKKICFNSPHNLNGKMKQFVFPVSETERSESCNEAETKQSKVNFNHNKKLSFIQRYK